MINGTLSALFSSSSANLPDVASKLGVSLGLIAVVAALISLWSLAWKGVALWKSAQKRSIVWFVILLVVNTLGILEILYIFIFSKLGKSSKEKRKR